MMPLAWQNIPAFSEALATEPHWLVEALTGMDGLDIFIIGLAVIHAISALGWLIHKYRAVRVSRRSLDSCRKWRER